MSTEKTMMNESALLEELNNNFRRAVMPVTVFVGVEAVIGFIGNLIVIFVFSCRYRTCNFKYFVLFLAITDITSCLTTVPGEMLTQTNWYNYPFPTVCKIKSFFNMFTVCCEDLCLLVIAIDRFRKVCRPTNRQIQPRLALYLCGVIYVTAFGLAFPVSIFWGTHSYQQEYKGVMINVTICEIDEQFLTTKHNFYYSIIIEAILSLTLLVMLVLYVFVAKTLICGYGKGNEINRRRESSNVIALRRTSSFIVDRNQNNSPKPDEHTGDTTVKNNNRESSEITDNHKGDKTRTVRQKVKQKTRIMLILTVIFIATTVLYLTLLSFIADGILETLSDTWKVVYFFFFRLYFVNHVINPLVYGCLDKTFQDVMRSCWKRTKYQLYSRHSSGSFSLTD